MPGSARWPMSFVVRRDPRHGAGGRPASPRSTLGRSPPEASRVRCRPCAVRHRRAPRRCSATSERAARWVSHQVRSMGALQAESAAGRRPTGCRLPPSRPASFAEPRVCFCCPQPAACRPMSCMSLQPASQHARTHRRPDPLLDAHGDEMTRAETVTLLNDMVVMAPGTLIDPRLRFTAIDAQHTAVRFTLGKTPSAPPWSLAPVASLPTLSRTTAWRLHPMVRPSSACAGRRRFRRWAGWVRRGGQPGTIAHRRLGRGSLARARGPLRLRPVSALSVEYNREVTGQR